jgi:hypothetical protein
MQQQQQQQQQQEQHSKVLLLLLVSSAVFGTARIICSSVDLPSHRSIVLCCAVLGLAWHPLCSSHSSVLLLLLLLLVAGRGVVEVAQLIDAYKHYSKYATQVGEEAAGGH